MELEALQETSVAQRIGLYIAFELGAKKWLVVFGDGRRKSRQVMAAGETRKLLELIERARQRFQVKPGMAVVSCYEAGRDGFWLHRWLQEHGVQNLVVDSASIEVNRRLRRTKTDRLDAEKLLSQLLRHCAGERVWSVLRVPTAEEEDIRRTERERQRLVKERGAHLTRMESLLVLHNIRGMPRAVGKLRRWLQDRALGRALKDELLRELQRLELLERQVKEVDKQSAVLPGPMGRQQAQLQSLRAIGPVGAKTLVTEVFGWRSFGNRRQLAGCAGLAPSPYRSGEMNVDQGISKAGIKRLRPIMVELSWAWLRYQPGSELARWYARRFGHGSKRMRRIGIVALARKLLIALWRFLQDGVVPEAARLKAA
jgi:transposase